MKNINEKVKAILAYEKELEKARDFYKNQEITEETMKDLDRLNAELKGIREVKKILEI